MMSTLFACLGIDGASGHEPEPGGEAGLGVLDEALELCEGDVLGACHLVGVTQHSHILLYDQYVVNCNQKSAYDENDRRGRRMEGRLPSCSPQVSSDSAR